MLARGCSNRPAPSGPSPISLMSNLARIVLPTELLLSCTAPEPEPDVAGEYVDLFLDEDVRVCAGQVEAYDAFIETAFAIWTGSLPDQDFRVHVHATTGSPCGEIDGIERANCAQPGIATITRYHEAYHEFAHTVVWHVDGIGPTTLSEGAAEALAPAYPRKVDTEYLGGVSLSTLFSVNPGGFDEYYAGGAFVKFLIDTYGAKATRDYYRRMRDYPSPGPALGDFEERIRGCVRHFTEYELARPLR